jgi:hypothetical protein
LPAVRIKTQPPLPGTTVTIETVYRSGEDVDFQQHYGRFLGTTNQGRYWHVEDQSGERQCILMENRGGYQVIRVEVHR